MKNKDIIRTISFAHVLNEFNYRKVNNCGNCSFSFNFHGTLMCGYIDELAIITSDEDICNKYKNI